MAHLLLALEEPGHMLTFNGLEEAVLTGGAIGRLLLAAFLGGVIGIDREYHHKPSGVRTNLLICFGASLFTFLSSVVAGAGSANKGQIASNIVQGIGFLGAGLIIRNRDRVSGLTSAATVWAVASVGMACGAGLYFPAVFSAALILIALEGVGFLEKHANLKLYSVIYEVRGADADKISLSILNAMDREKRRLVVLDQQSIGELNRLSFSVAASRRGHDKLLATLNAAPAIDEVLTFHDPEDD
ncbi:MgtC/SapB family protein [Alloacidobacterium dinghuense]|uniref:MgtC/SapB family protein n=1 Tax=Alloacidobacterium dinghuense TaxID=2763107 RepID=A0A7G8BCY7_9BACT|nr:MgtC/SapB family protein [Alloacidobacterium dinghuense]QNI30407.1 MgtC/SapB family protein [Alloacidobacterium dinghuense]